MQPSETICRQLGSYVSGVLLEHLPPEVVAWARVLMLDSVGCALGGVRSQVGAAVLAALGRMRVLDGGPATVPGGGGRRTAIPWAALAGSSFANALDYDDTLYGHPGSVIVPTALAMAEGVGSTGAELLAAVVAGYEVALRLSGASAPTAAQRTVLWGQGGRLAPAAAAVAARLLKLSPETTAQAIAIAAANGPVSSINKSVYGAFGPTMVKNNFGMAVVDGITSAFLAGEGFSGPLDIFEGDTGWWRMVGSDRWDPNAAVNGLGSMHEILRVELKPYPCCRFIHSPIAGVIELTRVHELRPEQIRQVEIKTFSWAATGAFANPAPDSMQSAQFSTPYCTAVALMGYPPGPNWFDPAVMTAAPVRQLAERVHLTPWPEADDRHLEEWLADVTIRTEDDSYQKLIRFPLGHPRNPMTAESAQHKFMQLAEPAVGAAGVRQLASWIENLHSLAHVGPLTELLGGAH